MKNIKTERERVEINCLISWLSNLWLTRDYLSCFRLHWCSKIQSDSSSVGSGRTTISTAVTVFPHGSPFYCAQQKDRTNNSTTNRSLTFLFTQMPCSPSVFPNWNKKKENKILISRSLIRFFLCLWNVWAHTCLWECVISVALQKRGVTLGQGSSGSSQDYCGCCLTLRRERRKRWGGWRKHLWRGILWLRTNEDEGMNVRTSS